MNERLDAIKRKKALKALIKEKEVQKLRKQKMVPYIVDLAIKAANMNNINLAQDLRKSKNIVTLR